MVMTTLVILEFVGDMPDAAGDPILMRSDATSWMSRCDGARDKRACLLMIMLRRLELIGVWNPTAKSIPAVPNTLEDGISRWPRLMLPHKVRKLTNSTGWSEQDQIMGFRDFRDNI